MHFYSMHKSQVYAIMLLSSFTPAQEQCAHCLQEQQQIHPSLDAEYRSSQKKQAVSVTMLGLDFSSFFFFANFKTLPPCFSNIIPYDFIVYQTILTMFELIKLQTASISIAYTV